MFLFFFYLCSVVKMKQYIMWIHKTGYLTQLHVSSYSEKLKQKIF